jgi:hypothetical protein
MVHHKPTSKSKGSGDMIFAEVTEEGRKVLKMEVLSQQSFQMVVILGL